MAGRRRLDPEEVALWARVTATVTPLAGTRAATPVHHPDAGCTPAPPAPVPSRRSPDPGPRRDDGGRAAGAPANTLDGGWDRRLRRGAILPDRSIDLHGHTLATAHAALEATLDRAVADEVRVLLVVTGKPPRAGDRRRGLIRASIDIWLAHSRHRAAIAAVRNAHPRHGGAGALYLILRRRRDG